MGYGDIAWLPLCAGVTAVGLVLSFLALRRRGAAAGLRGAAWSLLPMAAYLTGALPALWTAGTAFTRFVTGLVLSPVVWAGLVVTALAAVLFLVSGVLRRRGGRAGGTRRRQAGAPAEGAARPAAGARPEARPVEPSRPAADDDFSDIEEILKRRGIG